MSWPQWEIDYIELGDRVRRAQEDEDLGFGPLFDESARQYFESCAGHVRRSGKRKGFF